MNRSTANRLEEDVMHVLMLTLSLFALWTAALQLSTFIGISWTALNRAIGWLFLPAFVLTYLYTKWLAKYYADHLPDRLDRKSAPEVRYLWATFLVFLVSCLVLSGFSGRYALLMLCLVVMIVSSCRTPKARISLAAQTQRAQPVRPAIAYICLIGIACLTMLLVLSVNRPDFDDAEYIQFALQTLQHPERAPNTFDASLGIVLEQFRFAPYRITSYETCVALISQWTGLNVMDVYYLLVPAISAGLSILVAFVFIRWFLPSGWSLLAICFFLLISLAWGETHFAYGNRMYVRLFQGKGLLVAITTPITVIVALLWMRKQNIRVWMGILIMQVVAVGVSSSGLVITILSTTVGLLAGLMAQPSWRNLRIAGIGAISLTYPITLGLWIKFASSASGKVEEIGSYLPVDASLGGPSREALVLAIMASIVLHGFGTKDSWFRASSDGIPEVSKRTFLWLIVAVIVLVFNPVLINYLTVVTSRNMNWRLAWAAPLPLILATCVVYLLYEALENKKGNTRTVALLFPICWVVAFITVNPWTLARGNQVQWGWLDHKVPLEYYQAVELARDIRRESVGGQEITVLVEPRLGTWLTVVAPDFKLVMPGQGYLPTLETIMDKRDFEQRSRLVNSIDIIAAGDSSMNKLLDSYEVNVIAVKGQTIDQIASYRIQMRTIEK